MNCINYLQIQTANTFCDRRKSGWDRSPVTSTALQWTPTLFALSTPRNGPRFSTQTAHVRGSV